MLAKKWGMGLIAASILSVWAGAAQAVPIVFDPDGGGATAGDAVVGSFDWAPQSALAKGAITTTGGAITFDLLAHGSLGVLNNAGGSPDPSLSPGLGSSYEITFVTRFPESASVIFIDLNGDGIPDQSVIVFSGPPAGTNFFEVYFDSTPDANPIAGTGYNDGTLILAGSIVSSSGTFTSYFDTPLPGAGGTPGATNPNAPATSQGAQGYDLLDNFGPNNAFPGIQTVDGSGGTILTIDVTFQDNAFFKSNVSSFIFDAFTNTSNNLPFLQTDPSALFTGAAGGGAPSVAPVIGTINGMLPTFCGTLIVCTAGADVMFQQDANSSFNAVPEPATLILLGLGLSALGVAGGVRRLARKN